MSVLQVDSFAPRLGGTTFGHVGIAKMYCTFDGSAGTVSPLEAENVSSITDNGTGDYEVNFTNAMNTALYALHGSVRFIGSAAPAGILSQVSTSSNLTTAVDVESGDSAAGTNIDSALVAALVTGDLA